MTQLHFHCSNTKKVFVDQRGAVVDDLAEARDTTRDKLPFVPRTASIVSELAAKVIAIGWAASKSSSTNC
jgi:hypothetical protein